MSITVHRPAGANVTKENPIGVLYLSSSTPPPVTDDIYPDGSIRLVPSVFDEFHFQRKMDGVWGDASILASSRSLRLGRDLSIESGGSWIQTTSNSQGSDTKRLIPHVHYNNEIGSFGLHAPAVSPQKIRHIFIDETDAEISGTYIVDTIPPTDNNIFVTKLYLNTGTIAATTNVTLSIKNAEVDAIEYFVKTYPASQFPANSEIELYFDGVVQFINEIPINIILTSEQPISVKTSVADGGRWWLAADVQVFESYKLLEDRMVLNKRAGIILSRAGNFITANRVRNV